ncbi:CU044_5270 family protein [Streptomyces sp. NPDC050121]|uniref:CU044_5270 family protein n=1 Tax=Streptomyces sp. NPDC050121 TaxID=3365601 RepID=UPI00378C8BF8
MNQLPELPEKDLPPGRHQLLKEHLMTEIRQEEQAPVRKPVRKRNPWLRPALTAAAVATVAAVTFTLLPSSGDSGSGPRVTTAAAVLEDAALVAGHQNGYGKIRDDQFTYVETKVTSTRIGKDGKPVVKPLHRREVWVSVDGRSEGVIRDATFSGDVSYPRYEPENYTRQGYAGYAYLESLPTDPDAMHDWLAAHSVLGIELIDGARPIVFNRDQMLFLTVGDMMTDGIVPPAQAAALYRVAARIPGVTVREDAVDVLGRHGVAVVYEDAKLPLRVEWIFDKKTHQMLGQRTTFTRDYGKFKKGTVFSDSATVRRAVVDKVGQRP